MCELSNNPNIMIWEADADPGEPICIAGNGATEGFSVTLYTRDGVIFGVVVRDVDSLEAVSAVGYVPAEEAFSYA